MRINSLVLLGSRQVIPPPHRPSEEKLRNIKQEKSLQHFVTLVFTDGRMESLEDHWRDDYPDTGGRPSAPTGKAITVLFGSE
ncbi:hypothetical protein EYF80_026790 [Liparis tanakae]|uniref:Uncharacterized protein n=1 Tax=Liparis tanakae TaxID=230148 RepID=A0A4Z2HBH6_9TELE|nr:hypothetical protein EYF80_026790 [Liparis tanakae]